MKNSTNPPLSDAPKPRISRLDRLWYAATGLGSYAMTEENWRQAESHQARRERNRLIANGTIVQASNMKPQMMIYAAGQWFPEVVIHS